MFVLGMRKNLMLSTFINPPNFGYFLALFLAYLANFGHLNISWTMSLIYSLKGFILESLAFDSCFHISAIRLEKLDNENWNLICTRTPKFSTSKSIFQGRTLTKFRQQFKKNLKFYVRTPKNRISFYIKLWTLEL